MNSSSIFIPSISPVYHPSNILWSIYAIGNVPIFSPASFVILSILSPPLEIKSAVYLKYITLIFMLVVWLDIFPVIIIVVSPSDTSLTLPFSSTVAISGLRDVYVHVSSISFLFVILINCSSSNPKFINVGFIIIDETDFFQCAYNDNLLSTIVFSSTLVPFVGSVYQPSK